ncbi:MAG TPA: DUF488 domain-containing protein [Acetobacteraceae bacterium]|nr:DUF488 domain-containing protein [Acetobacteraceae bacterium]
MITAPPLATIGYEGTALDAVLRLLTDAGVAHLLDIRAVPNSRKPGFSKRLLEASAIDRGIRYTHLRALGTPKAGREAVRHGDPATMRRIFCAHMESDTAQAELAQATAIAQEAPACLLCFERDHTHCHRSIVAEMISTRTGQSIRHLAV